MSAIFYSKGWFRAKKVPLALYSAEQARALHDNGALYCALISSAERPTCFLEVKHGFVGVGFLDDHLRESLSYSFQEKAPGRLFLSMATWREFDGASDKVIKGTTYIFRTGGTVSIRREVFAPEHVLETADSAADVGGNWENVPCFGCYEKFTRKER